MATLLQYSTEPAMLLTNAADAKWTVTVANGSDDDAAALIDQIVLTIPAGAVVGDLVPAFADIAAGTPTGGWTCTLDATAGTATLAGTPLPEGQGFSVVFTLSAVTAVAGPVSVAITETGSGVSNSGTIATSVASTLLQYTLASTPDPLTEGAAGARLMITVTNVSGGSAASAVDKIRLLIPCGASQGNLVPSSSDFSVGTPTDSWAATQSGTVVTLTGPALGANAAFSVTLNLSPVSSQTGTSQIQVQEFYSAGQDNDGTFPVTVFAAGTVVSGPTANPVNISGTGSTSLVWSVVDLDPSYSVSLLYMLNGAVETASTAASGQWNSPTLTTTTFFTLQIVDGSGNVVYQSQIAVSVMPPMPVVDSFTGVIAWDTANNCAALTLEWQTGYATYCTLSEDGDLQSPQGSVTYSLGSAKTAAQAYTLTAINATGSISATIDLDWSQAATNQPSDVQALCQQLVCSSLTGNVYGVSGDSTPILNIITFGQTPSYAKIPIAGSAACTVFAAAPQASLASGASDTLYVTVDGDLQQWAVDVSTTTVTSSSVSNWPDTVAIASSDPACLIGTSTGTIAVACASVPGQVQIVDVSATGLAWSNTVNLAAETTAITQLVPLNLLGGFLAMNNADTGAVGYVLSTATATGISSATTPYNALVSADGTSAWLYDTLGAITLFEVAEAMPTTGTTTVTFAIGTSAPYLWSLFATGDGGAFVGLYGSANQHLINTVASIPLPAPGLANGSVETQYASTNNWNVQGGTCLTNGWPTVVLSTSTGFQIVRTANYTAAAGASSAVSRPALWTATMMDRASRPSREEGETI